MRRFADSGSARRSPERPERERRSGFSTPLAGDAGELGASTIPGLVLTAALAGLAVIALRPLLTAGRRRRGRPTDV